MIIDVLVEININKKDKTFSYSVPKSLESEIYELAGLEFNVSSPKQLGEVLFEKG